MNSHKRHMTLIRAGLLAAVLTAGGALVAYASLPTAANGGQAHAAAKSGNATQGNGHAQGTDENAADGTSTASGKLAANWDRLNATLNDVLARLKAGHASDAAVAALQKVIDRLAGDHGLHTAINAVTGDHGSSDLPDVATNHPGRP